MVLCIKLKSKRTPKENKSEKNKWFITLSCESHLNLQLSCESFYHSIFSTHIKYEKNLTTNKTQPNLKLPFQWIMICLRVQLMTHHLVVSFKKEKGWVIIRHISSIYLPVFFLYPTIIIQCALVDTLKQGSLYFCLRCFYLKLLTFVLVMLQFKIFLLMLLLGIICFHGFLFSQFISRTCLTHDYKFPGTAGAKDVSPELRVNPGNPALKARLMSIFCRSITAANSFPSTLQCIFGCIYGIWLSFL